MDFLKLAKALFFKTKNAGKFPYNMFIDIELDCNSKCIMCKKVLTGWNFTNKSMPFSNFRKIIDTFQPKSVNLCPTGEPFINPDLLKMISYLSERNIYSIMSTNTTLLFKHNTPEELISSGLKQLRLSIDGANGSTYKRIRGIAAFDTVVNNIRELIKVKALQNSLIPYLRLDFVVQNDNIDEMTDILYLAYKIGINKVNFRFLNLNDYNGENKEKLSSRLEDKDRVLWECNEAKKISGKLNIRTNIEHYKAAYLTGYFKKSGVRPVCMMPWVMLFCSIEGELMPCASMQFNADQRGSIGNIFEKNIGNIWNSDPMHKIRQDFRAKRNYQIYQSCRDCHLAYSLKDIIYMSMNINGFLKAYLKKIIKK